MAEKILTSALCCLIICRCMSYLIKTGSILKKGKMTEGSIVRTEIRTFLFLNIKCPVIEFTVNDDKKITAVFKPIWATKKFPVQEKVLIIYDPKKPNRFFVDNKYIDFINFLFLSVSVSLLLLTMYRLTFI